MTTMVVNGIAIGAGAATILATLFGLWSFIRRIWRCTVGRRRAQAWLLDQLACYSSKKYVESLFGQVQFQATDNGLTQCTYTLPGAWVTAEYDERDVMVAFSIVIRSERFWYSTERLTFGNLILKLGKDTLPAPNLARASVNAWLGAHTIGLSIHEYFGNPGQYQDYWLSHNMVGAGTMEISAPYRSGEYGNSGTPPDPNKIVINTLTVLGPNGSNFKKSFLERDVMGPHNDILRLAGYWRPPFAWNLRNILHRSSGKNC
ncbi:ETEC_3214 domain-containing protein [Candidatus Mycolicibacterium alkanivorans]|uniref:Uncharacterized protein n=1 Tax=Candidatus Mycolicibacterium alkanivorans TaxID=2954114 RepID=A0ABS9YS56_9MYCO|nr:ETEC_3214 domain-containing protein [Candidatus Mycolicibacterium alkanivorans]MCI4674065.1 hypothetical protein [Candidatus Mycolicibacterium alkanivorans]